MIQLIQLLVILSGTCALFVIAGIAVKALERYELRRERQLDEAQNVVRIRTRVRM